MTELEEQCILQFAKAKAIPADSITLETTLESLQVDSLDRVSLTFDLEEKYEVEIPDSYIHQIQTVGDVAIAVQEALLKKQSALSSTKGIA